MKIASNHRLDLEGGSEFNYKFQPSPNQTDRIKPTNMLIIHATEGPNVAAAVNTFMSPKGNSTHLVLGKDGKELTQLVGFNRAGVHANEYNDASIGIEMDYPGDVREGNVPPYKALKSYQENQYIVARGLNDFKSKFWPLYPKVQLDALFSICEKLKEKYSLKEIWGHEELKSFKMDPGPAFPIAQFRAKLFGAKEMRQETIRNVQVRSQPSPTARLLTEATIPARTPVLITNEATGWVLIQVMAEIDGNPWLVGWVESDAVRIRREPLMVTSTNRLAAQSGQPFRFVELPTANFDAKKNITKHKYVVMHVTTGTNMDSTINFFKNPVNRVSAHLLIGRTGQVVQFVPFDKIAYHAGFSWWEGDKNLNELSIGIELDNAGFLSRIRDKWMRGNIEIPNHLVKLDTHWKENKERAWQDFTQIQLDVTLDILKVLKEKYGIEEILGHDQVNMKNRVDPGPLFPMEDFRTKLFGRAQPKIQEFQITQEATLYVNVDQKPPDLARLNSKETLEKEVVVVIEQTVDKWILVKVEKGSTKLNGQRGWIKRDSVRPTNDLKKHKVNTAASFYKFQATPPPSILLDKPFPKDTRIRLQENQKDWALVALLDPFMGLKGLEGWVEKKFTDINR